MEETVSNPSLVDRMVRAAKLDVDLYEEVEADRSATGQAFLVVLIFSISSAIGLGIYSAIENGAMYLVWGLLAGVVSNVIAWGLFSFLTYIVGTKLFPGPETSADWGELLRTLGFSTAPGALLVVAFIPLLGGLIALAVWVWMIIAAVIAVRQALDFTTGRALATCVVGLIAYVIIMTVTRVLLGGFSL